MILSTKLPYCLSATIFLTLLGGIAAAQSSSSIASQSVVHYTFDESSGPAIDRATVGKAADLGNLVGDPVRVASPFWNQSGKKAIQLDAAKKQCLEIANSPDTAAPQGITIGMFCVNLTEPTDNAFHGLVAKRGTADGKFSANYGINFQMQSDQFQLYIHDGAEYRIASYSSASAVPFRKLTYVTVTMAVADAPGQDADTDVDDVRMQYFINGEALTPKSSSKGFVSGTEAWTQDVNIAGLLNSIPLSVGRSEPGVEQTSCIIGDFRILPRALSPDEVRKLFLEVVSNIDELLAADKASPRSTPAIARLSQHGVQSGMTTQIVVDGNDLGPNPVVVFPLPEVKFSVGNGSTANRLVLDVNVPASAVSGIYPLWIRSQAGITKSVAISIDQLPEMPLNTAPDKPAQLPAAFFGSLSGGQQQVVYLAGKKGQRVVADVELKRLGGNANPVIEIKSASGTPLSINWGQNSLKGDARGEFVLPDDGVYTVELHDLTFSAAGVSPFRLKIGDLKLVDGVIPAAALPGTIEVEPVGSGIAPGTKIAGQFVLPGESSAGLVSLTSDPSLIGSVPPVSLSRGVEIVEAPRASDEAVQIINAAISPAMSIPVAVSGRISKKGEIDRYLLNVTPGHKIKLTLQSDSLGSSLEGELRLLGHPQANVLAMTSDQPSVSDPSLEFVVPAGLSQVQVQIRDLFGRGEARSFYRLVVETADQPRFSLMVNTAVVNLPEDGSAIIEALVNRAGYAGPIQLSISGDPNVTVSPTEIAANVQGRVWLRLSRQGKPDPAASSMLKLIGQTVGIEPAYRRTARLQTGAVAPSFTDAIGMGTTEAAGLVVELPKRPTVLFRGVPAELDVMIKRNPNLTTAKLPVKLSLESSEPVRPRDRNNPAAGKFPVVTMTTPTVLATEPEQSKVRMTIPFDVAEPTIDFAIKGEALSHAYSDRVLAKAFSEPFHAEIKTAVTPKVDDATLSVRGEADHKITGVLQRTAGFVDPVEVTLVGLPAGYTVQPAQVAGDQDKFEIVVKGPKVTAEAAVPNVKARVTTSGSLLVPEIGVNLRSVP